MMRPEGLDRGGEVGIIIGDHRRPGPDLGRSRGRIGIGAGVAVDPPGPQALAQVGSTPQ